MLDRAILDTKLDRAILDTKLDSRPMDLSFLDDILNYPSRNPKYL